MSDTLLEPEDQNTWCDDCHGYTHMPYCPSYKELLTPNEQDLVIGAIPLQALPTDEHQPAARGGGDSDKWSIKIHGNEIDADLLINGSYVGTLHTDKARQVLTEHNQHHSLVAERERLRETLTSIAVLARQAWLKRTHHDSLTAEIFAEIAESANNAIEQRSTSE